MKLLFVILLSLNVYCFDLSDQVIPDSVKTVYNNVTGKPKFDLALQIAENYSDTDPEEVIKYLENVLSDNNYRPDKNTLKNIYSRLGSIYLVESNYNKALLNFLKALAIVEKSRCKKSTAEIVNKIGHVYNYLGNLSEALKNYKIALKLRQEVYDSVGIALSYNNIGTIYRVRKDYNKGLDYFFKSLEIIKKVDRNLPVATQYINIGKSYSDMGKFVLADSFLITAYKIYDEGNIPVSKANTLNFLCENAIAKGNYTEALKYITESLQILTTVKSIYYHMEAYKLLSVIYEKTGKLNHALKAYKNYIELRDSIYINKANQSILEIHNSYTVGKKESAIEVLEEEKSILSRNIILIITISLFVFILILFWILSDKVRHLKILSTKNRQLEEALGKAEKANNVKFEFLAQMSHEIRTPINTIINFSNLVEEEFKEKNQSSELDESFLIIRRAGKRIIRTINLLINMSELQSGSYEGNPSIFNLFEKIINSIEAEFRKMAKDKKIDFIISTTVSNNLIYADEYSTGEIIFNLLDNAIKFTNNGFVKLTVEEQNSELIVKIADTGIGMSEEYQKNLFNPFTQEEQGYTRQYEGNGLGLALVKKYCQLNNIKIEVQSQKGIGTEFTLFIPQNPL